MVRYGRGKRDALHSSLKTQTNRQETKAMSAPKPVKELVIELCPNPRALSIYTATPRAEDWIDKEGRKFSDSALFGVLGKKSHRVLTVNPCYDIAEVKKHLENPVYDEQEPIRLVTSGD